MNTPAAVPADACRDGAHAAKPLTSYRPYWARRFGTAPFLPMSGAEMEQLAWDSCDIVLVTGDAYVDHPSFGMAVIGRTLEAQGFRVGIIAQPDWHSADAFRALGRPNLFWGVTAGNMDSMINRYTAERRLRSDDAYTPGGGAGRRPDRAAIVYSQRCREAWPGVPVVLGGIEASLRRIAHYDYWSDKVRRSIVLDAKCDLLLYGNAERALVELAHRLAAREPIAHITDLRGSAFVRRAGDASGQGWFEIDSTGVDAPGPVSAPLNPYQTPAARAAAQGGSCSASSADSTSAVPGGGAPQDSEDTEDAIDFIATNADTTSTSGVFDPEDSAAPNGATTPTTHPLHFIPNPALAARRAPLPPRARSVIRLPGYEQVRSDPVLYAHASRVLHLETNPGNARALVQAHGAGAAARDVWINPPPVPLSTTEMDHVFGLPYARSPHPAYADTHGGHEGASKIPAWEMIRFSVNIMRGCFGGCSFCSITEHEGRIIQSRSEESILAEIEDIRDRVKGFTGTISDLGGPTANMYRLACRSSAIEAACRKPSCVYPGICPNLGTDHGPLVRLYRRGRALPGIRKILIASGLRYDLALRSPEYVQELVQHHVGGYLKIAPEHTEAGPLAMMMKPGIGSYERFRELFERFSAEAGKKQYLIPYFIAAHPGTSDQDMLQLALWLKKNGFRADQVQTFYPSPMASATAMYHSGKNPLRRVARDSPAVDVVRGEKRRRLHKAFLRYHDPDNWPLLRTALKAMGRADLIGNGRQHLIPIHQPATGGGYHSARRKNSTPARVPAHAVAVPVQAAPGCLLTQHTGLPPRVTGAGTNGANGTNTNGLRANAARAYATGTGAARTGAAPASANSGKKARQSGAAAQAARGFAKGI